MHLILTHEQADFDAVASQLGAHLLNETAVPVVSRKQNRNVRAFLTFYGADLPFVEARDLPSKPVRAVTLARGGAKVAVGRHPVELAHGLDDGHVCAGCSASASVPTHPRRGRCWSCCA